MTFWAISPYPRISLKFQIEGQNQVQTNTSPLGLIMIFELDLESNKEWTFSFMISRLLIGPILMAEYLTFDDLKYSNKASSDPNVDAWT